MAYFCRRFKKSSGLPVKLICNPYCRWEKAKPLWHAFNMRYAAFNLQPDDVLFFTEYLTNTDVGEQAKIALDLRRKKVKNPMVGLVHLPQERLLRSWSGEYLHSALNAVDCVVVFGSGLAGFFEQMGYGRKIRTTFHYADTDYYRPIKKNKRGGEFRVIVFGSLFRRWDIIGEIARQCPGITFDICLAYENPGPEFSGLPNVILSKYIPEPELLSKIQQADVSLSVFDYTVGSNTVVSSLACGLPQVVSDAGSIRDYCSQENAIFCRQTRDFVNALNLLSNDSSLCLRMGLSARKRAQDLSLLKSIAWFRDLFLSISNPGHLKPGDKADTEASLYAKRVKRATRQ